jgi:hypothetical protein
LFIVRLSSFIFFHAPCIFLLNLSLNIYPFTDSAPPSHTTVGKQVIQTLAGLSQSYIIWWGAAYLISGVLSRMQFGSTLNRFWFTRSYLPCEICSFVAFHGAGPAPSIYHITYNN